MTNVLIQQRTWAAGTLIESATGATCLDVSKTAGD